MENEKTAICFESMDFKAQESIINACLMNTAKMINSLQTVNMGKVEKDHSNTYTKTSTYRDCVKFLFAEHDSIFNTAWIVCMETYANNPLMPLALFVSKACGKALRKEFYWNAKSASEKVDTVTMVNCADSIESYQVIFDMDRIESILANIRDDIKDNCKTVLDMLILGYNYREIEKAMHLNEKTVYKYVATIANAIAIANAIDKEWNALDRIISSEISLKDKLSRMQLESAIIKAYKAEFNIKYESAIDWKTALERLKEKAYYESNQSSLASAFYSK